VQAAIAEIRAAHANGELDVLPTETRWLDRLAKVADNLPESEEAFTGQMMDALKDAPWIPAEYGL
jgi:hypothetical protein